VANELNNSVSVFRTGASGDVPPTQRMFGPSTQLRIPAGVVLF
jgi:hypothetical protein